VRRYLGTFAADGSVLAELPVYPFSANVQPDKTIAGGKVVQGLQTLYVQTLQLYKGRSMRDMLGQMLFSARDFVTGVQNQFVRFRGGAVTLGNGAVVLASDYQPHLPALVGRLLEGGARFLGDEMVHVDPILRHVHPLPFPLLLDLPDTGLFPRVMPEVDQRRRGRRETVARHAVLPAELGSQAGDPAPLRWLVFPRFDDEQESRLEAASGSGLVFSLTAANLNLDIWGDRGLLFFRDLLETSAVSRLTVGSIPEAADLIMASAPQFVGGG
jgi:hypothetical protein